GGRGAGELEVEPAWIAIARGETETHHLQADLGHRFEVVGAVVAAVETLAHDRPRAADRFGRSGEGLAIQHRRGATRKDDVRIVFEVTRGSEKRVVLAKLLGCYFHRDRRVAASSTWILLGAAEHQRRDGEGFVRRHDEW